MRVLETERLTLEPQVAAHADEMFAVLADPAIYEYENEPPHSVEWLRERFLKLESRESGDGSDRWLNWVVRLRGGDAIGYVQATVSAGACADIAYVFASRHWGRGLATEAVRAMIDEVIQQYDVTKLSAVLRKENARSLRLLKKFGFTRVTDATLVSSSTEPDELRMECEVARIRKL